jgi:hypothetical protein
MPVRTLSEAIDNLYTTTWQNMKESAIDQIFDATPFWFWMKDKGRIERVEGGRHINEPLMYAKNDTIKWLVKGEAVSLNDKEILTTAKFDWRYLAVSIVRFLIDDQQNRGKNQIINFMNAKLDNAKLAMTDELEATLFQGAGSASTGIDGLQLLVKDDPTTNTTIGEINQSTYTWWRNKTKNMSGLSFSSNGIAEMRTMLNNVSQNNGNDRTDVILTGQTPYEYYEDAVLDFYRVTNNKLADAGFQNQTFKGIPMIWSPDCANTRMYFLNTNFLKLVVDPMLDFDMTSWKEIPAQPGDRAAQIVSCLQLTTNRRRVQGVMHTIDTA